MVESSDNQASDLNVGEVLFRQRQKKGFSREYVACELRIRESVIKGIEEGWQNSKERLHTSFVKGFVRAYADFLELDGLKLAKQYEQEVVGSGRKEQKNSTIAMLKRNQEKTKQVFAKYKPIRQSRSLSPSSPSLVLGVILLLLVILVGLNLYDDKPIRQEQASSNPDSELIRESGELQEGDLSKLELQSIDREEEQTFESSTAEVITQDEPSRGVSGEIEKISPAEGEGTKGTAEEGTAEEGTKEEGAKEIITKAEEEWQSPSRIEVVAKTKVFLKVFEEGESTDVFRKEVSSGQRIRIPEGRQFSMSLGREGQWQDLDFYIDGIRAMKINEGTGSLLLDGYSLASGNSEWVAEREVDE